MFSHYYSKLAGFIFLGLTLIGCDSLEEYFECGEHYERCIDSPLGRIWDEIHESRCARCTTICRRIGHWPDETAQRQTCRYWEAGWAITGHQDGGVDARP